MPLTLPRPNAAPTEQMDDLNDLGGPSLVIVYNCDCHTFPEVEAQLQKATGCSLEKAQALSHEIDGQGVVYAGDSEKCEQVAAILRQIRLQVETDRS